MNGGFGDIEPWRVIVAAAVLGTIVTLTVRRVVSRKRLALAIGKWIAAAVGLAIGQAGLSLVGERELATIRPLGGVLCAWIGLIVGLQFAWAAVGRVPRPLIRWSALDLAVASGVAAATVAIIAVLLEFEPGIPQQQIGPWTASVGMATTIFACACLGWSPETRSLDLGSTREGHAAAVLVRAGSGLLTAVATFAFGVAASVTDFGPDGVLRFETVGGFAVLGLATLIASVVALGCWLLVERLARRPGDRLVITLGTLAILAGTAEWLHTTPLYSGLVCGAVLANLGGRGLRMLEVRLKDAELTLSVAVFLLAGLLLGSINLPLFGALVGVAVVVRVALKPAITALAGLPGPPSWRVIRTIARRPAPIAVAIGVAGVLLRDSELRRTVLAAALAVGFLMFLLHLVPIRSGRTGVKA